jgi:hypothetical protein
MTTARTLVVRSPELADLIGVTYRQLDYWARAGIVHTTRAPGSGNCRRWTVDAVQHAAIVGQLVNILTVDPAFASGLADEAVLTEPSWSIDHDGILLIGPNVWVPPVEDDEVEP